MKQFLPFVLFLSLISCNDIVDPIVIENDIELRSNACYNCEAPTVVISGIPTLCGKNAYRPLINARLKIVDWDGNEPSLWCPAAEGYIFWGDGSFSTFPTIQNTNTFNHLDINGNHSYSIPFNTCSYFTIKIEYYPFACNNCMIGIKNENSPSGCQSNLSMWTAETQVRVCNCNER